MQNEKEKFKKDFIKRLINFSLQVIKFCGRIKEEKISWSIADQLVRSATSIGANVVEAKSSSSKKDYLHFFEIALKSANETKYWLLLVRESLSNLAGEANQLLKEADEISRVIGSSVLTLKGKK